MVKSTLEALFGDCDYTIVQYLHVFRVSHNLLRRTLTPLLFSTPALLTTILASTGAYTSDRFSESTFYIIVPLLIAVVVRLIMSATTLDSTAPYVRVYL